MIDEVYSALTGDATLMSILTGGVYKASLVGTISRQLTPNAFDANLEILPSAVLKSESSIAAYGHKQSAQEFILVFLYQRLGYSSIRPARNRIFDLLHRQSLAAQGSDGLWRIDWDSDVLDSWDDALEASMARCRFIGYINRGVL